MRPRTAALTFAALASLGALAAFAQPSGAPKPDPAKPAAAQPAQKALETKPAAAKPADAPLRPELSALAFLEGAWSVKDDDGYSEEIWSGPHGNNIMGCFRWCKPDGTPAMFEILAITRVSEGVLLRMHHYSPTLKGKEDKDRPLTLRLTALEGRKAVFSAHQDAGDLSGVTYDNTAEGTLTITVAFTDASQPPLVFALAKKK